MIDARFRPLPKWTETRPLQYRGSQFKSTYGATLDYLEYELEKLDARNIVIEAGFARADIRNDGWPRGKAKPSHPGVILYFDTADGAMRFPAGTYSSFESNMHAIALTLVNLRSIDRYGVTLGHEQYAGFKQLTAPEPAHVTPEAAARLLSNRSGISYSEILRSPDEFTRASRIAVMNTHTDVPGRNVEHFREVIAAKEILESWFKDAKSATM